MLGLYRVLRDFISLENNATQETNPSKFLSKNFMMRKFDF